MPTCCVAIEGLDRKRVAPEFQAEVVEVRSPRPDCFDKPLGRQGTDHPLEEIAGMAEIND